MAAPFVLAEFIKVTPRFGRVQRETLPRTAPLGAQLKAMRLSIMLFCTFRVDIVLVGLLVLGLVLTMVNICLVLVKVENRAEARTETPPTGTENRPEQLVNIARLLGASPLNITRTLFKLTAMVQSITSAPRTTGFTTLLQNRVPNRPLCRLLPRAANLLI